jgi:hypothetical protein
MTDEGKSLPEKDTEELYTHTCLSFQRVDWMNISIELVEKRRRNHHGRRRKDIMKRSDMVSQQATRGMVWNKACCSELHLSHNIQLRLKRKSFLRNNRNQVDPKRRACCPLLFLLNYLGWTVSWFENPKHVLSLFVSCGSSLVGSLGLYICQIPWKTSSSGGFIKAKSPNK